MMQEPSHGAIVLDDAEDMEEIQHLLVRQSRVPVLVTMRRRPASRLLDSGDQGVHIEGFDEDESHVFVDRRLRIME